jgi:hypothetical protein
MARKRSEWIQIGSGPSYYHRVHRPLQCLIFITPLLLIYQIGALETRIDPSQAPRPVLAFFYLQRFFGLFGATGNYLPLLAVVFILIFWHIARKDQWEVEPQLYAGMLIESVLWAVPIFVIGLAVAGHVGGAFAIPAMQAAAPHAPWHANAILSIGAGIYEELLFRLIAITLLNIMLVDVMELKLPTAIPIMIVISAVLFSLYHYMGAEEFAWNTFFFRTAAGIYFAGIFIFRGFGIVVGCHAIYDLIVVLARHH